MLFEHVCLLFMSIGIILIIVGTILYIKNENDSKKASEDRQIVLRNQRMQRVKSLQRVQEKYKKIARHKSKYFTKGKFSISPDTECVKAEDQTLASTYKTECDRLTVIGDNLKTTYSEYTGIIKMLDPVIINLKEISNKLTEFIKYKTCDTYCHDKYPESKYYPDENICKCENPYFNSGGICVKCESPNVWENGICTPKCVDGYTYNNGICECVLPNTIIDGKCIDITEIKKFIDDVKILTDSITNHTPYNYKINPLLDEEVCNPNPSSSNKNRNGCNCTRSWECDSDWCMNSICETKPTSL
jgi:hypothetical protein